MADPRQAIGIFDSGVGGLTVLRQIAQRLPQESLLYFGDTARVPYGTKSPETVIRYARSCAHILIRQGIKILVLACNTASAHALKTLQAELDIPVVGVVEPGAYAAVKRTQTRRVGVIGTAGTVASGAYQEAIAALDPAVRVFSQACPLFVPLAEEGWLDGEVPRTVAQTYLSGLLANGVDTLVLGCTHYPLLAPVIGRIAGETVTLVDSAEETAGMVAKTLQTLHLMNDSGNEPFRRFLVSDAPESFTRIGRLFLGCPLELVEWVDF